MHYLMNRKSFTLLRFLVFFFLLSNISCQKEGSVELPGNSIGGGGVVGGSAQFALVPSGTSCSDAVVTGSFVAGTDLGFDAMLTVTVDVTKTGDWTYSTNLVNGFVFAGAGIFATTGKQSITLIAAGNPTKTGNSTFGLNIGGKNCTFTVPVTATGGGTTLAEYYYKATIGTDNYLQDATATNGYQPVSGNIPNNNDVVLGGGISSIAQPLPAGKTEFVISKGLMRNYQGATPAQFKAFFPVGSVSFAPADPFAGDGVTIYWTDPNGDRWTTRNGSLDQFGSLFKIISVTDFVAGNDDYVKVKVEFKCKLYHPNGTVKQVTNGEAVVAFVKEP
jgi:hypothetical protein